MRTRTSSMTTPTTGRGPLRAAARAVPAAAAVLALALSACTSDDPPSPDAATGTGAPGSAGTDDAAGTSDDGLEGEAGSNGWFCDTFSPTAVDAAAGGTAVSPRQVVVEDTPDSWVCEVTSGGPGEQEPVLRMTLQVGEEARATARERAEQAEDVRPGPAYLGRSYISPGLVTGLSLCTAPDATSTDDKVPFTFVAESLQVTDEEMTDHLRSALALAAQNYDRSLGCSPKQAAKDLAEETTAP